MFDKKAYAKEYYKKWYIKNREISLKKSRQWAKDNPERTKIIMGRYNKKYYINNREKWLKYAEQHRIDKEKRAEYNKKWRKNNIEKCKEYSKGQYINGYYKQWQKNKYKTDLKFNINRKISTAIRRSLKEKKNGRHWEDLVPYNFTQLKDHLQKTLPRGYIWQDYLEGKLHIDHKIPISAFNFTKPEHPDFKRCWALSNLQLLPAEENRIKNNKLDKPFQPTLKLCLE